MVARRKGIVMRTRVKSIGNEAVATTSIEEGETHPTTEIGVATILKVGLITTCLTKDQITTVMVAATGCMATLSSTKAETTTTSNVRASIKVHEKLVRMVDLSSPQVMVVHQRGRQTIIVRSEPTNDVRSLQEHLISSDYSLCQT